MNGKTCEIRKAGLEHLISRSYFRRSPISERSGHFFFFNVLWDELDDEDSEKLVELGWEAVDDYVGYETKDEVEREFYTFFDLNTSKLRNNEFTKDEIELIEEIAFEAYKAGRRV